MCHFNLPVSKEGKIVDQSVKAEIEDHEVRLKQAMLQSDISILDKLLSPELVFTNHLGQLMTKDDDLNAHLSGALNITTITLSDQKVKIYGVIAIVTLQAYILGSFGGEKSEGNFRFTRIWRKDTNEIWQVVAGHSSIVV